MEQKLEEKKKIIMEFVANPIYVPMKKKELAIFFSVAKEDREEFDLLLDALVAEGKLHVTKRGKYIKGTGKQSQQFLIGTFQSTKKGFGFVTPDADEETGEVQEDIFIPEHMVHGAFHMDRVEIVLLPEQDKNGRSAKKGAHDSDAKQRREGEIVRIISHEITKLVGYYQKRKNFGFVVPDNQRFTQDVYVPLERSKGAVSGHKVVCELTSYGNDKKKPEGKIIEILGHVNDPGTDIISIVKGYDLPVDFPKEVMDQVEGVPGIVREEDKEGRLDLRNKQTVTIDGEDAKDLDDAITIERKGDGYVLGVHIADVSHYVTEKSPLDKEALRRGTSVYLVDRVIPMLPHKLSNGICSLNQGEDRLALSCIMEVNANGSVTGHQIAETIICVDRRMSYTNVKKILEDKDETVIAEYSEFVPMFRLMEELATKLRTNRHARGSIDFDFAESKIILNEKGKPVDIIPYERNTATKIIEDFMLLANETVAEDYFWQEVPFLYRTHEKPDSEKMKKMLALLNNFGYSMHLGRDEIHPKEIQKVLEQMDGTPEEPMLSRILLRSMKQARYTPECSGHFGLSAKYYTHFTSPIRRYPDLQIHRIIKENLRAGLSEKRLAHYSKILPEVGKLTSSLERRAEEAERETDKLKKAEYMIQHIGECYEGIISGITAWGMYVELPNTVEGCVHVSTMQGDYFVYDEANYEMVGELTNKRYRMGQKVWIRVMDVDKLQKTIDFALLNEAPEEMM
ncbi:MAG: ribonuclease R [Lachnospiraceae bacterium]|nr:ribonuclease R [Lachnospiraceae bacterium]